jgi:hypothetical protein
MSTIEHRSGLNLFKELIWKIRIKSEEEILTSSVGVGALLGGNRAVWNDQRMNLND